MKPSIVNVAYVLAVLLTSVGGYKMIDAFTLRLKTRVDSADRLTVAATDWARELKAEAAEARAQMNAQAIEARDQTEAMNKELDASAAKVSEFSGKIRRLSWELDTAYARLRRWKMAILDTTVRRDQLVRMVETDLPNEDPRKFGERQ